MNECDFKDCHFLVALGHTLLKSSIILIGNQKGSRERDNGHSNPIIFKSKLDTPQPHMSICSSGRVRGKVQERERERERFTYRVFFCHYLIQTLPRSSFTIFANFLSLLFSPQFDFSSFSLTQCVCVFRKSAHISVSKCKRTNGRDSA